MDETKGSGRFATRFVGAFDWLNRRLMPAFGPPPLGPFGRDAALASALCPVCSHPMDEHVIDHSTPNAVLNCPVPHERVWEFDVGAPVNEFGMVKHEKP